MYGPLGFTKAVGMCGDSGPPFLNCFQDYTDTVIKGTSRMYWQSEIDP